MTQSDANPKDALKKWYSEKKSTLHSNLKYKWISSLSAFALAFVLLYSFSFVAKITTDMPTQIVVFAYLAFFIYIPMSFYFRSFIQIMSEYSLNQSIHGARKEILDITNQKKEDRDLRSLQRKIRALRNNLLSFVKASGVITPVIYDYELVRLYMGIDAFFSTAGEALLENRSWTFSRMQEIAREEQNLDDYLKEKPTRNEIEEHFEAEDREKDGIIKSFDFDALDEFLRFLGDTLFYKTKPYQILPIKHSMNVVQLSRFIEHWNDILATSKNSKKIYKNLSKDIQLHYEKIEKREAEHQQRMSDLRINLLTIFVSVSLSAVVSVLLR